MFGVGFESSIGYDLLGRWAAADGQHSERIFETEIKWLRP